MKKAVIWGVALAAGAALLALVIFQDDPERPTEPPATNLVEMLEREPSHTAATSMHAIGLHEGLLYGRVVTEDGVVREGRLRFGGNQEALWGHYFNGLKPDNVWLEHVEGLPDERASVEVFGFELPWRRPTPFSRPFMARFGDIARIEPRGRDLFVTLKSGTMFHLDRYAADDLADGVRMWDDNGGVVDIDEWSIRSIEFLTTPDAGDGPLPLFGTVHTRDRTFTGFIQWNRQQSLVTDEWQGVAGQATVNLRFDTIRSITRRSDGQLVAKLSDDREAALAGDAGGDAANHDVFVDDVRYGRVLVAADAIEQVEFGAGGTGPAYDDFSPGRPLIGQVVTRSGRRLAGRLVYDLDESETTETLDASSDDVDYTIPFGVIATIDLAGTGGATSAHARVVLRDGEALILNRTGDLAESNAGLLVFPTDGQRPELVRWSDVERVDLDE